MSGNIDYSAISSPSAMHWFYLPGKDPLIIVPGSVRFTLGNSSYIDAGDGTLKKNLNGATGTSTLGGTIDYLIRLVRLTLPQIGTVTLQSLLLYAPNTSQAGAFTVYGRLPKAPIRLGSFEFWGDYLDGSDFTGSADNAGVVTGTNITGTFDHKSGFFRLIFASPIHPQNLYFNAVSYYYLPLSSEELGIDTVRFPQDGAVPVFKRGDVIFLTRQETETLPNNLTPGQVIDLTETNLTTCHLLDQADTEVNTLKYSVNLALGEVTMANPLDLSGYVQPLQAKWTILQMARAIEVWVSGEITLSRTLSHDYPMASTTVSSAVLAGDRFARVAHVFTQQTWTGAWSDSRIGASIDAQLNTIDYPVVVTNLGAIQERWVGIVRSGSNLEIIGEHVGSLGVYNMAGNIAPVNLLTGEAYFEIDYRAFGALNSWNIGNCLRLNTVAAAYPFWTIRSLQPSAPAIDGDGFEWGLISDVEP